MKWNSIAGPLFIIASYFLSFAIFARIIDKRRSKKEIVYYLSRIATIKNIVKMNHQSQIFNDFNEEGNLEGININYQRLQQLITEGGCKKGYKKCGILDTIGNILCIEEVFPCPINHLNIDLKSERKKYLDKGFKEIYNENLIYNYQFYYSNQSLNNNITVSVLFSQNKPNYITMSNFVIDTEAYEDLIGELPAINEENTQSNNLDNAIQDVLVAIISDTEPIVGSIVKVGFSLLSFVSDKYKPNEKMEKFKKYVEEKIKSEENKPDEYFINIGENAYIKNYIGFRSMEDMETFMNFDYKIYKKIFPSNNVKKASIAFLILDFFLGLIECSLILSSFMELEKDINDEAKIKDKNISNNNPNGIDNDKSDEKNMPTLENIPIIPTINNEKIEEAKKDSKKNNNNNKDTTCENSSNEKNNDNNNINNDNNKKQTDNKDKCSSACILIIVFIIILFLSGIFFLMNLWILLSAVKRYLNINNKFKDLRRIKSDNFINGYISEFITDCTKKSSLYYFAIIAPSISMGLHLIGLIVFVISFILNNK